MIRAVVVGTGALVVLLGGATGAAGVAIGTTTGIAFATPVHGAVITQGFGCTAVAVEPVDRTCPGGHWHSGVDLAAVPGTPVYATAAGWARVVMSETGFGLHVVIDHGNGMRSLYGHLSSVSIVDGGFVSAGERIGAVGSTGNSTGPHLHFEIDRDGIAEDPRPLVPLP